VQYHGANSSSSSSAPVRALLARQRRRRTSPRSTGRRAPAASTLCAAVATALTLAPTRPLRANPDTFTGGGNWSDATKWSLGHAPLPGDDVTLTNSAGAAVVVIDTLSNPAGLASLEMDAGFGASLALSQSILTVSVTGTEIIGFQGAAAYNQSGGVNTAAQMFLGDLSGSSGAYNLTGGGVALANNLTLGGGFGPVASGSLLVDGGSMTVVNTLHTWGPSNPVTLQAGTLSVGAINDSGLGFGFNWTGGTLIVTGAGGLTIDSGAIFSGFTLGAGKTLTVSAGEIIGDTGAAAVDQSAGGTHTIGGAAGLILGNASSGNGTLKLGTGAVLSVTNTLTIGNAGAGTLLQTGGSLTAGSATLGVAMNASGTFNQSGGVNTISGRLAVGAGAGSFGAYAMSNGAALSIGGSLLVGTSGNGSFIQTGGVATAQVNLSLGSAAGGSGIVTLSGGSMNLGGAALIGGAGLGALTVTGTASLSMPGDFVLATNGSTFTLGGNATVTAATVSGPPASVHWSGGGRLNVTTPAYNAGIVLGSGGFLSSIGPGQVLSVYSTENLSTGTGVPDAFTQTGGSNLTGFLNLNGGATYNLSGDSSLLAINGNANFGGGTEYIAQGGDATFNQSGGTHTVGFIFALGYAPFGSGATAGLGTYNLTGGSLRAGTLEQIGYSESGSALFNQTGGSNLASTLWISANGTYTLGGTGYLGTGGETIALDGLGTLVQSGGTQVSSGTVYIGGNHNSNGTATISGGLWTCAGQVLVGASGAGTLNVGGGTMTIGGSLTLSLSGLPCTLNVTGGNLSAAALVVGTPANYAQTGGSATFGPVSGGPLAIGGGTGAATFSAASISQTAVSVSNGGSLALRVATNRITDTITALTLSGSGKLDLANHALLTSTLPATIKAYLAAGYGANQDWAGPGLTSSVAAANPTKYSLVYASGSDQSAKDAGIAVAPGQTLVQAVLTGDANMDGTVNFFDITQLLGYKYNTGQPASYTDGDLNYDGVVDFFDLSLLLSANYNTSETYLGAVLAAGVRAEETTLVPEPSGPWLAILAATSLLRRRRPLKTSKVRL
jgi:T5SS/PEP-CTERM-associated repeat protein